jgi:clan AA aspartic protease (TIGR02281 family)
MGTFGQIYCVTNCWQLFVMMLMTVLALNVHAQNRLEGDDLFGQLQTLQEQMHIKITGLERIQNEEKIVLRGNLEQQLAQLLTAYNHITNRNPKGQIEQVVIINKKQKTETQQIVLPTRSEGKHLIVSVSLSGDGRIWQTLDMIVDTGADLVVLPESMIPQLGLAGSPFTRQKMQTANGTTVARVGMLQELKIAGETLANVEVAFIADPLLGGSRLLGMSVLGRYQINIDDQSQSVTLFRK